MGITISNVSVVQGTGAYVKESVLEVSYTLAADGANAAHTFDLEAQFKLTTALPAWNTAYLYPNPASSDIKQTSVTPGTYKLLVRVPTSLLQAGVASPFANYTGELLVQVRAKDTTTNEYSAYAQSAAATLKAKRPVVTTATCPQYIGGIGTPCPYNNVPLTLAGNDGVTPVPGNPAYYRASQDLSALADGLTPHSAWSTAGTFAFSSSDPNGLRTVYVKTYDQYYNSSDAITVTYDGASGHYPWLQKDKPTRTRHAWWALRGQKRSPASQSTRTAASPPAATAACMSRPLAIFP